jgi:2-aminoadipate transaminase
LHTPTFNQRLVAEVLQGDFLAGHVPTIRALYQQQCQAMLSALAQEMNGLGVRWNRPLGGMFLWLQLPKGMDAAALLPHAVARGVAFVPGAAFFAAKPVQENLRLSFTTADESQIRAGIAVLAQVIQDHLPR